MAFLSNETYTILTCISCLLDCCSPCVMRVVIIKIRTAFSCQALSAESQTSRCRLVQGHVLDLRYQGLPKLSSTSHCNRSSRWHDTLSRYTFKYFSYFTGEELEPSNCCKYLDRGFCSTLNRGNLLIYSRQGLLVIVT